MNYDNDEGAWGWGLGEPPMARTASARRSPPSILKHYFHTFDDHAAQQRERQALELENESQLPGDIEHHAAYGYRDILPLLFASGIAKLFGVHDMDLAQGLEGFLGGRQEYADREYENAVARDARRRQQMLGNAQLTRLDAAQLRENQDRQRADLEKQTADRQRKDALAAMMKMPAEIRTPFLLQRLNGGDPEVTSMFSGMPPDQVRNLLYGEESHESTAAVPPQPLPFVQNEWDAFQKVGGPRAANTAQQIRDARDGLSGEAMRKHFDEVTGMFTPEYRARAAERYARHLHDQGHLPNDAEMTQLMSVIDKQLMGLLRAGQWDQSALETAQALKDLRDRLVSLQELSQPAAAQPGLTPGAKPKKRATGFRPSDLGSESAALHGLIPSGKRPR